MPNEIIPYLEMCQREGLSLQKGMNYGVGGTHSVILMSLRPNAPYQDKLLDGGATLIYEGHDVARSQSNPNPKVVDQPGCYPSGTLTENGKFYKAAQEFKAGQRRPERVRVYEKILPGVWSYNGMFHLFDSWRETSGSRTVLNSNLSPSKEKKTFRSRLQWSQ
jgi:hypothetical protein